MREAPGGNLWGSTSRSRSFAGLRGRAADKRYVTLGISLSLGSCVTLGIRGASLWVSRYVTLGIRIAVFLSDHRRLRDPPRRSFLDAPFLHFFPTSALWITRPRSPQTTGFHAVGASRRRYAGPNGPSSLRGLAAPERSFRAPTPGSTAPGTPALRTTTGRWGNRRGSGFAH
jgi:hypothetical protein